MICSVVKRLFFMSVLIVDGLYSFTWYGSAGAGQAHNCVNCAIATDATLAGNPASALPINSTDGVSITVLEKQFGTKFLSVPSAESIYQKMIDIGAGARGIVYGSYGPGQPGNVFNVVNQNGGH
ncbi:toxin glutamine deamidase domain-containing protein [Xanthomonas sacchari]|uniref:toxin glutamine deamidase domain-containing protein n=1 Tax=Xanthomonas sacchari TaxID=56458 RepID=UPI003D2F9246